ncbi:sigma factor-like helix-turn-helix DNA-binding protein [Streptomyces sp. O3]
MRQRQAAQDAHRAREFEAFVAGAAGRLLHAATLLTAEPPAANPRARRLLTAAFASTYAGWDRLRGDDPYEHARQELAARFARGGWYAEHTAALRRRRGDAGVLAPLSPRERLVLVLRFSEGVAEEQTAAQLGLPVERVRALTVRGMAALLSRPRADGTGTPVKAAPS